MNIKVCGITQFKQLQQLEALNIDYAGLIFYPGSPWYAGDKLNKKEVKQADFDLKKVGIFINPVIIDVLDAIDDYGLDAVQLDGNETPEMCRDLSEETEVIKTFNIGNKETDADRLIAEYDDVCDYYLFDAAGKNAGGSSVKFDWVILKKAKIEKPFFISGGIGMDDIEALRKFTHPDFLGVNINSRFEKEPGVKDMGAILQFRQALK